MGGHGLYVWLCYGVSLIVVLGNVLSVRTARARYLRLARAIERRLGATLEVTSQNVSDEPEGSS